MLSLQGEILYVTYKSVSFRKYSVTIFQNCPLTMHVISCSVHVTAIKVTSMHFIY